MPELLMALDRLFICHVLRKRGAWRNQFEQVVLFTQWHEKF